MHYVERFAVFYIYMLLCLQNLQATGQKVRPYQVGHGHILHNSFAFYQTSVSFDPFCTSPMEGTWNSMHALEVPCSFFGWVFFFRCHAQCFILFVLL